MIILSVIVGIFLGLAIGSTKAFKKMLLNTKLDKEIKKVKVLSTHANRTSFVIYYENHPTRVETWAIGSDRYNKLLLIAIKGR